jgi:hypothetical protein
LVQMLTLCCHRTSASTTSSSVRKTLKCVSSPAVRCRRRQMCVCVFVEEHRGLKKMTICGHLLHHQYCRD